MFDTHCHLQTEAFRDDLEAVLARAREAGVERFLIPAIDHPSFNRTLEIAGDHSEIVCALGIHPHHAAEWNHDVRQEIQQKLAQHPEKVRAIGEIGLDYYYDFSPKDLQRQVFAEQIELAMEERKPIIIHTRDSEEDVWKIVDEHYSTADPELPRGQFHCFSGSVDLALRAVSLGFCVSFTGNVTFKKSTLSEVVRETPLEAILLETDSPYLAPVPMRGKRNEPAFLRWVAEKIAEIKQLDVRTVMTKTFEQSKRVFLTALPIMLSLFAVSLVLGLTSQATYAQRSDAVGSQPPDSVLTSDRRKAEEAIKQQQEELAREAEQRRQDSVRNAAREQKEIEDQAARQAREDSAKAAQRIAEDEAAALRAKTPIDWKAIGISGGLGIGNMQMILQKPSLTPTSVFASSFGLSSQITRSLDLNVSFSHLRIGDTFEKDSVFNFGPTTANGFPLRPKTVGRDYRYVLSENADVNFTSFDLRYLITPHNNFKFYFGLGYTLLKVTNNQKYRNGDTTFISPDINTFEGSFSRGALKALFGIRYDVEMGHGFTFEPFAEISALGAFSGEPQGISFVLRADPEQITMTHLNIGATFYFGWWSVPRQMQ